MMFLFRVIGFLTSICSLPIWNWSLGYNWLFLTTFDFTIIFHLATIYLALFGVIIFSTA